MHQTPGFDNWLVWWAHLNVIDVTFGLTMVHLAKAGSTIKETSHLRRRQESGFTYNEQLTGSLLFEWDYFKGCTSRTSHVLHFIPKDIHLDILQNRTASTTVKSLEFEASSI